MDGRIGNFPNIRREMDGNIRREIFPLVLEGKFGLNLVSVLTDAIIF